MVCCWLVTLACDNLEAENKCPLLDVDGFNICRVLFDSMHGVNLGVAQHIAGNLMWEDVQAHVALRKDYDRYLEELWHTHKRWCADHGISTSISQFSCANLGKAKTGGYPVLHAKAAHTRYAVAWLAERFEMRSRQNPRDASLALRATLVLLAGEDFLTPSPSQCALMFACVPDFEASPNRHQTVTVMIL